MSSAEQKIAVCKHKWEDLLALGVLPDEAVAEVEQTARLMKARRFRAAIGSVVTGVLGVGLVILGISQGQVPAVAAGILFVFICLFQSAAYERNSLSMVNREMRCDIAPRWESCPAALRVLMVVNPGSPATGPAIKAAMELDQLEDRLRERLKEAEELIRATENREEVQKKIESKRAELARENDPAMRTLFVKQLAQLEESCSGSSKREKAASEIRSLRDRVTQARARMDEMIKQANLNDQRAESYGEDIRLLLPALLATESELENPQRATLSQG